MYFIIHLYLFLDYVYSDEWTFPNLFRLGASALLTDIERQIQHGLTGMYAASYYMAMG